MADITWDYKKKCRVTMRLQKKTVGITVWLQKNTKKNRRITMGLHVGLHMGLHMGLRITEIIYGITQGITDYFWIILDYFAITLGLWFTYWITVALLTRLGFL